MISCADELALPRVEHTLTARQAHTIEIHRNVIFKKLLIVNGKIKVDPIGFCLGSPVARSKFSLL